APRTPGPHSSISTRDVSSPTDVRSATPTSSCPSGTWSCPPKRPRLRYRHRTSQLHHRASLDGRQTRRHHLSPPRRTHKLRRWHLETERTTRPTTPPRLGFPCPPARSLAWDSPRRSPSR